MDEIQKVLVKVGRKDLAQEYYRKAVGRHKQTTILPMGSIDLVTGKSKYFNIYEEWKKTLMTCEIYKSYKDSSRSQFTYKLILGSGNRPIGKLKELEDFANYQSGRFLFKAEMIDSCLLKDLPDFATKYAKKIDGFVYK